MEIVTQEQSRAAQAEALRAAIRKMFSAQGQLREVFPKRLFTPDGRMIGDIDDVDERAEKITQEKFGAQRADDCHLSAVRST